MFKYEPSPSCRAGRLGRFRPVERRHLGTDRAVARCAAQGVVERGGLVVFAAGACRTALTAARTHLDRRLTLTVGRATTVEPTTPSWRRLMTTQRRHRQARRRSSVLSSTVEALLPRDSTMRAAALAAPPTHSTTSSRHRRPAPTCAAARAPQMARRNMMMAERFGNDGVTKSQSRRWTRTYPRTTATTIDSVGHVTQ